MAILALFLTVGMTGLVPAMAHAGAPPTIDVGYAQQSYHYEEGPEDQEVTFDGTLKGPSVQIEGATNSSAYWWSLRGEYLTGDADYKGFFLGTNIPSTAQTDDTYERARAHVGRYQNEHLVFYTGLEYEEWEADFTDSDQLTTRTYYHIPFGIRQQGGGKAYEWTLKASANYIPTGSAYYPPSGNITDANDFDQEGHGFQVTGEYRFKNDEVFEYGFKAGFHYRDIDRSDYLEAGIDDTGNGQADRTAEFFEPEHQRDYITTQFFLRF